MSDEDDPPEESGEPREDEPTADRDEPLGDVASEVRDRTDAADRESPDQPPRTGPLADVASEVDERRRPGDPDDAFEAVEVGELDGEQLWAELAAADDAAARASVPVPEAVEVDLEWAEDRDVRTIPKSTCHGCPHFGEPPTVACTHEGTDILAMADRDHFRVADCPIVAGEDELTIGTGGEEDGPDTDDDAGPAEGEGGGGGGDDVAAESNAGDEAADEDERDDAADESGRSNSTDGDERSNSTDGDERDEPGDAA